MLSACAGCGALRRPGPCPHCGVEHSLRRAATTAAVVLGLMVAGCDDVGGDKDTSVQALYGVTVTDTDGDGYVSPDDCDEGDDTVHPGAEETAGDGIDSNCDGEDDT